MTVRGKIIRAVAKGAVGVHTLRQLATPVGSPDETEGS